MKKSKAERKKEQIIETALEIVQKKGFSRITMEEIAAELELTKGSLYYYFKNKGDLLFQCHKHVLLQGMGEFESVLQRGDDIEKTLKEMVYIHMDKVIKEKEAFNLLINPREFFNEEQFKQIAVVRKKYEAFFVQVFERGVAEGKFTCKDITMARLFILGGMNWAQLWYSPNGRLSKSRIKELYFEYILKILK